MNLRTMFEHQRAFNKQVWTNWPDSVNPVAFAGQLQTLALGMVEETLEFLRTYEWKSHRKTKGKLQNVAHSHEELIDMFKYWLSLADMAEFPIDQLEHLYYAKSRVVQYRYQEEWLTQIKGPCAVIDIDNVLADYTTGICEWIRNWAPNALNLAPSQILRLTHRVQELKETRGWVDGESLGLSPQSWSNLKHAFRSRGGFTQLPVTEDAKAFLNWVRSQGWLILLVTSRPVDRYPNLFSDTLAWLHQHKLPFDHLWWADDKALRLEEYEHISLRQHVVFAVDDDLKFIQQYKGKGITAYHLNPKNSEPFTIDSSVMYGGTVQSLSEIPALCGLAYTYDRQSSR